MIKSLKLTLLFTFVQTLAFGQNKLHQKIDSLIISKMNEYKIVGLSIGIVKDEQILYSNGYGFTDIDRKHHTSIQTRFNIASITKLFTATAVMQLAEQGKLDINRPLIEYLPEFVLKDSRYKEITLFHLLTHSSGLPWDSELKKTTSDSLALQELVLSLTHTKLNFKPGEKFDGTTYSNTGYDILGYLIQQTTKTPFDRYIKNNILGPLGMDHSTFSQRRIPIELLAKPLKVEGKGKEIRRLNLYGEIKKINPVLKYPGISIGKWPTQSSSPEHYPSSYLYSSTEDLSKWVIEYLNISNKKGGKLLSTTTVEQMWALQKAIKGYQTSIGLGWWRFSNSANGDYVFHVGREPGYSSVLRIYPAKNTGIIILSNAYYACELIWNELPELIMKAINDEK